MRARKKRVIIIALLSFQLAMSCWAQPKIAQMEFTDAAVIDVVKTLAKQARLDVVISGDTSQIQNKRTTLTLKDISAEEAINFVLEANGLSGEKKGQAFLLSLTDPAQASSAGEPKVIALKNIAAKKVESLLAKIYPDLKASIGATANTIILQGKANLLSKACGLIAEIDRPLPQVLIESKVLEITKSAALRLGVSYSQQSGGITFVTDKDTKRTKLAEDINITVNALISDGCANVIASPKIATLDDHEAIINIGQRIPYAVPVTSNSSSPQWSVEYIDAGVRLKITPTISENKQIIAEIVPEVSSVSEWRTTAAGEFPVITTRNAQATLRVKDGETIVVGGLLSETDRENVARIPVLGYLPVVGLAFQNTTKEKTKTEIVFLITPHII